MLLCDFCKETILDSGSPWNYHHGSVQPLKAGAAKHCVFCTALKEDVETFCGKNGMDVEADLVWPMHRWTVRNVGRIRESMETIAVTFRPLPRQHGDAVGKGEGQERWKGNEATLPERRFYSFPEQDLGRLPTEFELGDSTDLESSGGQIKRWIHECTHTHKGCKERDLNDGDGFLPTRLVAVGQKHDKYVRVVETKRKSTRGPYATLSHCWGDLYFYRLNYQTRAQLMGEGVPLDSLALNFQQAIAVTRFLGLEYIWIDSLCIIQKEGDDLGDFKAEGDLMHKVYSKSFCNIAAADSSQSSTTIGGLFRQREAARLLPARYLPNAQSAMYRHRRAWRTVSEDMWDAQLLGAVLYTRAWVFQERLLAPRILHFSKNQIFWDCATTSACEALPFCLPQPLDDIAGPDRAWRARLQKTMSNHHGPLVGAADGSLESFWKSAVRRYTSCDLRNGDDKLRAIWGIAKPIRDVLDEEYGAGLWENNLAKQLAWKVVNYSLCERPSGLQHNPSWSWTSMKGPIEVQDRLPGEEWNYIIKDHHGGPISFMLTNKTRLHPVRTLSNVRDEGLEEECKNQGQLERGNPVVSNRTEALEIEGNEAADQPQDQSETNPGRDRQPELQITSIAMRAHVGRVRLWYDDMKLRWTLKFHETTDDASGDGLLEVFPDVKPKPGVMEDDYCYFVMLAWSEIGQDEASLTMEANASQISRKEHVTYSGLGLTLKSTAQKQHFHRTGSLHFRNVGPKAWECLHGSYLEESQAEGEWDKVNGLKFWLD